MVLGATGIPLGLGLNFVINGVPLQAVPMAVEEPSVVAACSGSTTPAQHTHRTCQGARRLGRCLC